MATRDVQEILGQMQKTLECAICLEMFTNPVSTSCGHQFCRFCLMEFLERKKQVPCPLCKKPITKRSLMEREQLGQMVNDVRQLISAFQKDTGALFSPLRGPEVNPLIGTPESIRSKVTPKQSKSVKKNVRRSSSRLAGESNQKSVHKSTPGSRDNAEPNLALEEQQLLQYIEEGSHCASRHSPKRNNKHRQTREGNNSVNEVEDENELMSLLVDHTSFENEDISINGGALYENKLQSLESTIALGSNIVTSDLSKSIVKPVGNDRHNIKAEEVISLSDKSTYLDDSKTEKVPSGKISSTVPNEENENDSRQIDMFLSIGDDKECTRDKDLALSGHSAGNISDTSSGPLFKTPLDPKMNKNLDPVTTENVEHIGSISTRARVRTVDANDEITSLTPEVDLQFDKNTDTKKTYGIKNKKAKGKGIKVKQKVSEWLESLPNEETETVPEASISVKSNQMKACRKKDQRIRAEEEKMGLKLKHLAEQVAEQNKNFIFVFEDGGSIDGIKAVVNDTKSEPVTSVCNTDSDMCQAEAVDECKEDAVCVPNEQQESKETENNAHKIESNPSSLSAAKTNLPVKRKRIFKTKAITPSEKDGWSKSGSMEDDKSKEKTHILNSSDPYEFKSSQPTPVKPSKVKSKKKQNATAKSKIKTARMKKQLDLVNKVNTSNSAAQLWNKDSVPPKTILKNRPQVLSDNGEIKRLKDKINQAEDFDLMTCTQEAADRIEKECSKKVRFSEPVISDFIAAGRIDVKSYREAKVLFHKNKDNNVQNVSDKTEGINMEIIKDRSEVTDDKDVESDDLSEDYRFHDDSSGTEDLDIHPNPEQFEQPTTIMKGKKTAEEKHDIFSVHQDVRTPVLPKNLQSPLIVIEETPVILTGSNPSKQENNRLYVKTLTDIPEANVTDEPAVVITSDMEASRNKEQNNDQTEPESVVDAEDPLKADESELASPDTDINSLEILKTRQDTVETETNEELDESEIIVKKELLESKDADNGTEIKDTVDDSDCIQSHALDNLVAGDEVPQKTNVNEQNNGEIKKKNMSGSLFSDRLNSESTQNSESILKSKASPHKTVIKNGEDKHDQSRDSTVSQTNMKKGKKKRKCFMLGDTESLDFGSYVDELDENKSKLRKGQDGEGIHDNSTKKTSWKTDVKKTDDLAHLGGKDEKNETEELILLSPSIELIEDTAISGPVLKTNEIGREGVISIDSSLNLSSKESVEDQKRITPTSQCLSKPTFGSLDSDASTLDPQSILNTVNESEMSENDTGISFSGNKLSELDTMEVMHDNLNINEKVPTRRIKDDVLGSQEGSLARQSVHDLSGLLCSPNESFSKNSGQSEEDIFQMDSEFPTVDASPLDVPLKLIEPSPEQRADFNLTEASNYHLDKDKSIQTVQETGTKENSDNKTDPTKDHINDSVGMGKPIKNSLKTLRGFAKRGSPYRGTASLLEELETPIKEKIICKESLGNITPLKYKSPLGKTVTPKMANSDDAVVVNADISSQEKLLTPQNKSLRSPRTFSNLVQESHMCTRSSTSSPSQDGSQRRKYTPNPSKYSPAIKRPRSELIVPQKAVSDAPVAEVVELEHSCGTEAVNTLEENTCIAIVVRQSELDGDSALPDTYENKKRVLNLVDNKGSGKQRLSETVLLSAHSVTVKSDNESEKDVCKMLTSTHTMETRETLLDCVIENTSVTSPDNLNQNVKVVVNMEIDNHMNHSQSSSDFKLDSSDEECSPEKRALQVISDFNELKDLCEGKREGESRHETSVSGKVKKTGSNFKGQQSKVALDNDRYSTNLDSSPVESKDGSVLGSQLVILESDVEEDSIFNGAANGNKNECDEATKTSTEKITTTINSENEPEEESDSDDLRRTRTLKRINRIESDEDDDKDTISLQKTKGMIETTEDRKASSFKARGVKRIIESEDSEDEDGSMPDVNMTSSSVYSSQSENLNSQERLALEKDLERLAEERAAIEKQLKQHKQRKEEVTVDPDEVEIIDEDSDGEGHDLEIVQMDIDHDFHASQPPLPPTGQTEEIATDCVADSIDVMTIPDSEPREQERLALANIDMNIPEPMADNPVGKKRNIGIVVTGLSTSQIKTTKHLAALNDAKFFTKFNGAVTHVVVKPVEEDDLLCERTLKFFQGIACKCWVVNYFWVVDSKQAGYLLPEGPYEIQGDTAYGDKHLGPRRSRMFKLKLFEGINFHFLGDNEYLSKESLTELIQLCGGQKCDDLEKLGHQERSRLVAVSCTDMEEADEEQQREINQRSKELYKVHMVVTLAREWVLDSLTLFKLMPLQDYLLTNVKNIELPVLN